MDNFNQKIMCDAHTHFVNDEDLKQRIEENIISLVSNSTSEEINNLLSKNLPSCIIPTFGVHPWNADKLTVKGMMNYITSVPIIGEIGMDSVWCDVPLDIQQNVFEEQLKIAMKSNKPVILHTKGQEKEIADIIRKYPNKYLIHWYSCNDYLEEYINQGCYFSVGPDVWWNPATQNVAKKVPSNRILTETDGLNAVQWAYDEAPNDKKSLLKEVPTSTKTSLEVVINTICSICNISKNECINIAHNNLINFINK